MYASQKMRVRVSWLFNPGLLDVDRSRGSLEVRDRLYLFLYLQQHASPHLPLGTDLPSFDPPLGPLTETKRRSSIPVPIPDRHGHARN